MAKPPDYEYEPYLEQAERIEALIEEDVPEKAKEKAKDFFESVLEGVKKVALQIEDNRCATTAQQQALDNWEEAVKRWIH